MDAGYQYHVFLGQSLGSIDSVCEFVDNEYKTSISYLALRCSVNDFSTPHPQLKFYILTACSGWQSIHYEPQMDADTQSNKEARLLALSYSAMIREIRVLNHLLPFIL